MLFRQCPVLSACLLHRLKHFPVRCYTAAPVDDTSSNPLDKKVHLISERLRCSTANAASIVMHNNRIQKLSDHALEHTLFVLQAYFNWSEILRYPEIVSLSAGIIEQRYHILEEIGFSTIKTGQIIRFNDILKKPTYVLKRFKLIPIDLDPATHMVSFVSDASEELLSSLKSKLPPYYTMMQPMDRTRRVIVKEVLQWKLGVSSVNETFSQYKMLGSRSLQFLLRSIDILRGYYGLDPARILANASLLLCHPSNLEEIASQVKTLGGMKLKEMIAISPRLLVVPSQQLLQVDRVLQEYRVTPEQITRCPGIYLLHPTKLRERFDELFKETEFAIRKDYPRLLHLVYQSNKAKERLNLLKELGYNPISIGVLTSSSKHFVRALYSGGNRSKGREACIYVAKTVSKTLHEVKDRLRGYPSLIKPQLLNTKLVIEFLLNEANLNAEQIWDGIHIILYDVEVVKQHWNGLEMKPYVENLPDWRNHPHVIKLLMYDIEVNSNFSGLSTSDRPQNDEGFAARESAFNSMFAMGEEALDAEIKSISTA